LGDENMKNLETAVIKFNSGENKGCTYNSNTPRNNIPTNQFSKDGSREDFPAVVNNLLNEQICQKRTVPRRKTSEKNSEFARRREEKTSENLVTRVRDPAGIRRFYLRRPQR